MWNIIEFDEVTSTNEIAAEMLARGEASHGDVVQARHQTAGRGRGAGRVWNDEPGSSLLMSIILERIPEPANLLQYRAALAILEALRNIAKDCGSSPNDVILKWPNDILIERKKVCGILLEAQWSALSMRSAVIGIGVNVKQESFPASLAEIATSLNECGIAIEVNDVRDRMLSAVTKDFYSVDSDAENPNRILGSLRAELEWMSRIECLRLISVDGVIFADLNYAGIADSGGLLLRRSDGSMMVAHSGSLSWSEHSLLAELPNG